MKLTMLGTGNAAVTECYNTCFVLEDETRPERDRYWLVDGGGGNLLLKRLKEAGISWRDIRVMFLTHRHLDHLMGMIWMLRMILQGMQRGEYEGEAVIYGHDEVIALLRELAQQLLTPKECAFLDARLHLIEVKDGETREILGRRVTFFDIGSTKAKQYGFSMEYAPGRKLTCCGDEPYNEREREYAEGRTGCSMRRSAFTDRRTSSSPIRSTIRRWPMPQSSPGSWAFPIWCCITQRTETFRSGRLSTRRRESAATRETFWCRRTWK